MAIAPYAAGDRVLVEVDGQVRPVLVSAVVAISAHDPSRRWRLLCRDVLTDTSIGLPVYCGDDGLGDLVRGRQASASA